MTVICYLLNAYLFAIFGRILMSWFPMSADGALATVHGFLHLITEPVLGPVRRLLPAARFGSVALDLSPILVIIGLQIVSGSIC